jgi:hypothetical protein
VLTDRRNIQKNSGVIRGDFSAKLKRGCDKSHKSHTWRGECRLLCHSEYCLVPCMEYDLGGTGTDCNNSSITLGYTCASLEECHALHLHLKEALSIHQTTCLHIEIYSSSRSVSRQMPPVSNGASPDTKVFCNMDIISLCIEQYLQSFWRSFCSSLPSSSRMSYLIPPFLHCPSTASSVTHGPTVRPSYHTHTSLRACSSSLSRPLSFSTPAGFMLRRLATRTGTFHPLSLSHS